MAIQLSTTVRTTRLDDIDTAIGTTGTLEIRTGAQPADCATADAGTLLATITLTNPAFQAASAGTMAKSASAWTTTASAGAGATPGHFRIKNGATCHVQGSAGVGSGDLNFDGTITSGQTVTVTTFTLTDGNA